MVPGTEESSKVEKRSSWMNSRAVPGCAYQPTPVEHWANMVTHGLFVLPALYGYLVLIEFTRSDLQWMVATVYGMGLIGLFTVSTVFHIVFYLGNYRSLKEFLHRGDRAMIYIFIATSYTPWLFLRQFPEGSMTVELRWCIWLMTALGIIYQQLFHEKYKMLETLFYLIIGVTPSLALLEMDDASGVEELKLGGAIYILGVIFFKLDGRLPLAHAIWHLFVVLGAFIHYYAVLTYLIMPRAAEMGSLMGLEMGEAFGGTCDAALGECESP